MFDLFGSIEEWIRDLLTGFISSNLTTMFTDVNDRTGTIAAEVGQTPQGWNSGIFSMIQSLSDSVIVPIAGLIITFVLCYELITMITERNNMHDIQAAEALETRYMLCPVCNFKVRKIPVTQTEVVFVKCQKCKFEGVLSPAYFRTLRRRRTRLSDTRRKRMIR